MDLLNEACKIAKVGGWSLDAKTGRLEWTDEIFSIHEVGVGYEPTISRSLSFYAPEVLPLMVKTLRRAIKKGESFDLELPFITARKKSRWVRVVGKVTPKGVQASRVIGIIQDITDRKQKEIEQHKRMVLLRKTLGATIQAIVAPVMKRSTYTIAHQKRVADLARSIAKEMRIDSNRIDGIRIAAEIHDIGNTSVKMNVLNKPGKMSDGEAAMIRQHPKVAYDMLRQIKFPWPIARIILEHHERVNGSGYPNGLTGEKLLMESKILAVADVVEAIASARPYHPALGIKKALKEISQKRGIFYDPEVVDACLRLFREKKYYLILTPAQV
jgi:putative nucleotidyltransferase with HDIG domain